MAEPRVPRLDLPFFAADGTGAVFGEAKLAKAHLEGDPQVNSTASKESITETKV